LAADPSLEPVHRARVALTLATGGDVSAALFDWAAEDPDHVRLRGGEGSRDLPWAAVAPWTWRELAARCARCGTTKPAGADAVGAAWRAAEALPDAHAKAEALATLGDAHPELEGLARERYALAAGEPERAVDGATAPR
jgi:hypothetical protein